ncbi:hypothetical protein J4230_02160 [Candidatus Woesearchaeota archaeon]|nr:hypothetical protein [Candidatus Woesearchaeota archaeon]
MALNDLLQRTKSGFYEILFRGSTAFPYSNDLMHIGIIGTVPFLFSKYGAQFLGNYVPFLKNNSDLIGFGCAVASELIWQLYLEPKSPYDHPEDKNSDFKGVLETAVGAGLAYLVTKLLR